MADELLTVANDEEAEEAAAEFINQQPLPKRGLVSVSQAFAYQKAYDVLRLVFGEDKMKLWQSRVSSAHADTRDCHYLLLTAITGMLDDMLNLEVATALEVTYEAAASRLNEWRHIIVRFNVRLVPSP